LIERNMHPSRAVSPLIVLMLALTACSSPPPAATPAPSAAPSPSPALGLLGEVAASSSPTLHDKSCPDFVSPSEAQEFYIEAGGPEQDLHGLDPDRNGNACDESGTASPAAANGVGSDGTQTSAQQPAAAATPQGTPARPKSYNSSDGAVDGKSGGSDRRSSCESSDEARCD
jgi:hypothetical protein